MLALLRLQVPALAKSGAAHVTMLQRSPTYMIAQPSRDPAAHLLRFSPTLASARHPPRLSNMPRPPRARAPIARGLP